MTRSNLYTILCTSIRLGAVYLFISALIEAVNEIFQTRSPAVAFVWIYELSRPVVGIVLALLLWMFPGPLARIAGNRRNLEHFESQIPPRTLQYLALSILGLWFVITGLAQLAYTLHSWIVMKMYAPPSDPKLVGWLFSEVLKIFAGAALALGSRGVVGVLARFRMRGRRGSERVSQEDAEVI